MTIVLATCAQFLAGDHPLAPDDRLLLDELSVRGQHARMAAWDDPTIDWTSVDLVVIRSTWDYVQHPEAFRLWIWYVKQVTHLYNQWTVVQWNLDKRYLHALSDLGIPIVPTCWLNQGVPVELTRLMEEYGWDCAVIKPSIGNNSWQCLSFDRRDPGQLLLAQEHLQQIFRGSDAMLQPYLSTLATHPEQSYVFLGGQWSHTFVRPPFPSNQPSQQAGTVVSSERLDPATIGFAQEIFQTIQTLLKTTIPLARIDLVQDEQGRCRLMEAELIEPILHLEAPGACARVAELLVREVVSSTDFSDVSPR